MFNQVGGAAAEVLLKFCVVFVIALSSFAVGTFAGKKFTEDQVRLSAIDIESADRGLASVAKLDVKPSDVLSEEDLKSLTEEFSHEGAQQIQANVSDKQKEAEALAQQALEKLDHEMKVIDKVQKSMETTSPQANAQPSEKKLDQTTLVAERIATNQDKIVVAPKKEVSRIPASYPAIGSSVGKYTVQVASYKSEAEAKAFAEDLVKKGLTAYYVKAELKGQPWYRVSIGSFNGQDEANKYLQKIYQEAKLKGFVTRIAQ